MASEANQLRDESIDRGLPSFEPATAQLRREHDLILRVLDGLEAVVRRLERKEKVSASLIAAAIDALSAFADGCHHAKEEEGLFPALQLRGLPREAGPLTATRADHDQGRRLLRSLRSTTGTNGGSPRLAGVVREYAALLRLHIAKENDELFPLAERLLTAEDHARLARTFAEVEERGVGAGVNGAMVCLAEALEKAGCARDPGTERSLCARDVMRPDLPTLRPEMSLSYAAEVMEPLGVRELAVLENGRLVGILSERDLRPHLGHHEWTAVRTAMTRDPIVVAPDMPASAVARLLLEHGFNGVPVVSEGRIVGMVARTDLLRLVAGDGPK
jgi:CBS domain-containing protein/hemerythrin-like domain-containing protein